MPTATFNTVESQEIPREMLLALLNTATYASPTWRPIGSTVTDGGMEFDWGEDKTQDILGVARTTLKKPTVSQSFSGVKLMEGDPAYEQIWVEGIQNQNPAALSNQDVMVVHLYAGASATPFAERYPKSAIRPTSIGGQGGGFVEMDLDLDYGGDREVGTAAKDSGTGEYSFTKTV